MLRVSTLFVALAVVADRAPAQSQLESLRLQEFGISQEITYELGPADFVSKLVNYPLARDEGAVYCHAVGGLSCAGNAPVHLPSGVRIASITVFYYDISPTRNPIFYLFRTVDGAGPEVVASYLGAGPAFSGGFTSVELAVSPDHAVTDNADHAYMFLAYLEADGTPHQVNRVAIRYMREVSPAPASASFDDVPEDHPYFRHIEALFDSGITAGCNISPPMFCADRPITRSEMAVFLAKALGLHWP